MFECEVVEMLWRERLGSIRCCGQRCLSCAVLRASGLGDEHATGAAASFSSRDKLGSFHDRWAQLDTRNSPRWPEERYESCASHTRF